MVEINKFVTSLVEKGEQKTDAETKVKAAIAKIKEKMGADVSDEKIEELLSIALASTGKRGETYKGICVGFGNSVDRNAKFVREAIELYNKDKKKAISTGVVKEETGLDGTLKLIAVDMREFIDKAGTIKNWNYGKEFKQSWTRSATFIVDGALTTVSGNIEPQVGVEYNISGKKNGVIINAYSINSTRKIGTVELWDLVYNLVADDERSVELAELIDLKPYERRITIGMIKSCNQSAKSGKFIATFTSGELPSGMTAFSGNDSVNETFSVVRPGDEFIAFVSTNRKTEGFPPSVTVEGIIINPASEKNAEVLGDIDFIINE